MSKFASVLLKIIIFVSLMGILIFVGIAIFNNQNISFEAYNYIVAKRNDAKFAGLQNEIEANVKWNYGGAQDTYAKYINDAIKELNLGIDYHLDYLALEEDLSKGEQDKLSSLYGDYTSKFNECKEYYTEYILVYKEMANIEDSEEETNFAENILRNKAVYLIKNYAECYKSGAEFFKYLVEICKNYSLNGKNFYTYTSVGYMIETALVLQTLPTIDYDMDIRNSSVAFVKDVKTYDKVDSFYDFVTHKSSFGDNSVLRNIPFKNFLNCIRLLDIYEWAGNYENYYEKLTDNQKYFASTALNFYNENYREA